MSLATLYSIGDRHEQAQPIMEQIDSVNAYGDNVAGETATRTVDREFRWSTDNSTWSAWATTTSAALSALSLDPNDPLYLQFAWERTGSDASGLIVVGGYSLQVTTDPNATVGRGRFTNTGINTELREFIPQVIAGFLTTNGAGDAHHKAQNIHPSQLSNSPKPLIYVYDYAAVGEDEDGLCATSMELRFRVGVKRLMSKDTPHYTQLGWVQSLFRRNTWNLNEFNIAEFKGVAFPSTRLQNFGITECAITSVQERYAAGNPQDTYDEFGVVMKIKFKNLSPILIN